MFYCQYDEQAHPEQLRTSTGALKGPITFSMFQHSARQAKRIRGEKWGSQKGYGMICTDYDAQLTPIAKKMVLSRANETLGVSMK
jgi:hypothetical protein